ncbi:hypothetical protein G6F37_000642 [Rhizopus arrhizus]|nr:hypothetical protein G6F38_005923 [Rhizopus arrhizus]KAG1164075.1 hypothetical protein G6F37_000642 [Rhizopus arrhizus]
MFLYKVIPTEDDLNSSNPLKEQDPEKTDHGGHKKNPFLPSSSLMQQFFYTEHLADIGAHQSPFVHAANPAKQKIGWIQARLCAPVEIKNWKDLKGLCLNHETYRLLILVVFLLFAGLIEIFMAQWSDMRYDGMSEMRKHPLMDVLHDAFPRIENYQIVNYLLTTCVAYTLTAFALQSPDWSTRLTLLRRWTFLLGLLYIFRGLTLFVTTLPSSLLDECRPPETELTGTVGERFGFIYNVVAGSALGCTDNIFSGHTSVMMSCVILWRVHSRMRRLFSWLLYLLAFSGILMIILSRFHYTIDVLLALFITYMTWNVYLQYIREASMRYMFGFTRYASLDLFQTTMTDGAQIYQYLNWQPYLLGQDWMMTLCIYVDGLDIRLRSMGILDEQGELSRSKIKSNHFMKTIV